MDRVAELEERIQQARDAYYNGQPTLSDDSFDVLVDELVELKSNSPAVTAVGAPVPETSAWPKVSHLIPMGSLDKVQSVEAMTEWIHKVSRNLKGQLVPYEELLVTEKLDGISIRVEYVNGKFVQAVTRGDGSVGQDITPNVGKMRGVPPKLSSKLTVSLRGEIVIRRSVFKEHFQDKASARNAASGTATRFDGQRAEHLTVYFYQVHGPDFTKDSDQFEWLSNQGLLTPSWYVTAMAPGIKTPQDIWVEYQQATRDSLDYEIDGLVVRLNDFDYQLSLGVINERPKGAVAFKFTALTRETPAIGLDLQVGGMGHVTPVAVLRPVMLLGAEVSRASLYNWEYIRQIGFHVGATVVVTRSNDVIPRVVSVTRSSRGPEAPPTHCPECKYELERSGEYLVCPNTAECPAQISGRLKKWVSELGVLEWGDGLIEKVVQSGVSTVPGLYRLSTDDLAALDRMGPTSAKNAHTQLWSVIPLALEQFVGALGVPLCATSTMELVIQAGYSTLDKFKAVTYTQLQAIPGMGPKRSEALIRWLQRNGGLLDELISVGVKIKAPTVGALTGKSFCFTGKMKQKRPLLEKMAKDAGGQIKDRVGKGLSYLVIADPNSSSTKAVSARKNGTLCISEEEFLGMVS